MTPYNWELRRYDKTIIVSDDGDGAIIGTYGEDGTVHGIHLEVRDVMKVRDALDDYIDTVVARNGIAYLRGLIKEEKE